MIRSRATVTVTVNVTNTGVRALMYNRPIQDENGRLRFLFRRPNERTLARLRTPSSGMANTFPGRPNALQPGQIEVVTEELSTCYDESYCFDEPGAYSLQVLVLVDGQWWKSNVVVVMVVP
jgi:hypothetical protein